VGEVGAQSGILNLKVIDRVPRLAPRLLHVRRLLVREHQSTLLDLLAQPLEALVLKSELLLEGLWARSSGPSCGQPTVRPHASSLEATLCVRRDSHRILCLQAAELVLQLRRPACNAAHGGGVDAGYAWRPAARRAVQSRRRCQRLRVAERRASGSSHALL
jgi:hypothetical protein